MSERVMYLVRSWPRLSQTFIVNEVLALERRGVRLAIFALVRSGEGLVQPAVEAVAAPVSYLEDRVGTRLAARMRSHLRIALRSPRRYAATLLYAVTHPRLAAGYGSCSTLRCFGHAVHLCEAVEQLRGRGDEVTHIHAHFAHDPALVGLLLSRLTSLPFSFTGHARDLLQIPARSLAARAAAATVLVTCCEANARYVSATVSPRRLPPMLVVHHGVELNRFRPRVGAPAPSVPSILSVGRLVEKKGFDDLLAALARVKEAGVAFRCVVYGDGPLRARLEQLRDVRGLRDQVRFAGAASSPQVTAALERADLFLLTARETADGDRDGIPNVLVEAMACAVPVVTTSAGGIPELVRAEVNGLVVPPADPVAASAAVRRLLADPTLRRRLGDEGRRTVQREHDVDRAAETLASVFRTGPRGRLEVPA